VKLRLVTALALVGALFLSVSGAQAATPVLDGKVKKKLEITAKGGLQDNTSTMLIGEEREYCTKHCARLPFVYKPAKGIKGGLMFTATWSNPASDIDLTVVEAGPKGAWTEVGSCNGAGNMMEKVYIPPASLRAGKTYAMIMFYFRSVNETFKGKVEINVPSTIKPTVPAKVDEVALVNCTL
jgi:hypothetical protein